MLVARKHLIQADPVLTLNGPALSKRNRTQVPSAYIQRTLDLYSPEFIAVTSAEWANGHLDALVRNIEYPFTLPGHIEYVTASMALLYVAQASYLNCRLCINTAEYSHLPPVTDDDFFRHRDSGDLIFSRFGVRFRSKIPLSDETIGISHRITGVRVSGGSFFATFACQLHRRACRVEGTLAMPVPRL